MKYILQVPLIIKRPDSKSYAKLPYKANVLPKPILYNVC